MVAMHTEQLYLHDAYLTTCAANVLAVDGARVCLDRTVCYATGGGQPHDTGSLTFATSEGAHATPIVEVRKVDDVLWHTLAPGTPVPAVGDAVQVHLDWDRRHALMRTHTALHVLCGVIWHTYGVAVTGGNMEPLSARMDFEFDPLPEGFGPHIERRVNDELLADRPIEVSFLARDVAVEDADLLRTKVNLIPASVREIRVVDIVGLDRQADGGTHVRRTAEVGWVEVVKTESKGKANKRIRLRITERPTTEPTATEPTATEPTATEPTENLVAPGGSA